MGRLITPVQNVIDVKDQLTFKVLLANRWNPIPEIKGLKDPKRKESGRNEVPNVLEV